MEMQYIWFSIFLFDCTIFNPYLWEKIPLASVRTTTLQAVKKPPYHSQFIPKRVTIKTKQSFFNVPPLLFLLLADSTNITCIVFFSLHCNPPESS